MSDEDGEIFAKPAELVELGEVTKEMFDMLRTWFEVPATISLNLTEVDSATAELGDPVIAMAMAMRKLQALHFLSMPGVRTTTDVIFTLVQDLDRALAQAPTMRLSLAASQTDWDTALTTINLLGGSHLDEAPLEADVDDPESVVFRDLHAMLHDAVYAVMEASRGKVRSFE